MSQWVQGTMSSSLPAATLLGNSGRGDGPRHTDEVGHAVPEHLLTESVIDPPHGDHGDRHHLFHGRGQIHVDADAPLPPIKLFRKRFRRDGRLRIKTKLGKPSHLMGSRPLVPYMDGVRAGFLYQFRGPPAVLGRKEPAVVDAHALAYFYAVDDKLNGIVFSQALFHLTNDLYQEPRPVLDTAPVNVRTPVPERGDEAVQEMAAAGIYFDAVEARLLRPHGGGRPLIHHFLYFGDGKRSRHLVVEVRLRGEHHRRSGDEIVSSHCTHRADVVELEERRAAMFVDHVHQVPVSGDMAIIRKTVPVAAGGVIESRAFHDNKADAALGDCFVICQVSPLIWR